MMEMDDDDEYDDDEGGDEETSYCSVFAMRCRRVHRANDARHRGDDDSRAVVGTDDDDDVVGGGDAIDDISDEYAVMVGMGPLSPYLHRGRRRRRVDRGRRASNAIDMLDASTTTTTTTTTSAIAVAASESDVDAASRRRHYHAPLAMHDDDASTRASLRTPPATSTISILSPTLLIGTGGKYIDSKMLLRRTIELALACHDNDDGGLRWFVDHSLETDRGTGTGDGTGTTGMETGMGDGCIGGTYGVDATSLARRIADMAQYSTQTLGGRYGRMLSVSTQYLV
jgi:hypothetical protein